MLRMVGIYLIVAGLLAGTAVFVWGLSRRDQDDHSSEPSETPHELSRR